MVFFDLSYRHVGAASIVKRALTQFVTWLFIPTFGMILIGSLLFMSLGLASWGPILLFMSVVLLGLFFVCCITQWVYFLRFHVTLDAANLTVSQGWLLHRVLVVPTEAVQDIIIEEDSFDRWQRLATVHILANERYVIPIGSLDGLTAHQAVTLREMLMAIKENRPIVNPLAAIPAQNGGASQNSEAVLG